MNSHSIALRCLVAVLALVLVPAAAAYVSAGVLSLAQLEIVDAVA